LLRFLRDKYSSHKENLLPKAHRWKKKKMLDLITLAASMGLQGDLVKMREETNAPVHEDAQTEENVEGTTLTQAADAIGDVLGAAESTVACVASAMVPSASMVSAVMEGVALEAPTVDLTLPTQRSSKK